MATLSGSSAKARRTHTPLRALVCLRDGLTADSTVCTIPELKRAAEVDCEHPDDPTIHQALTRPGTWLPSDIV